MPKNIKFSVSVSSREAVTLERFLKVEIQNFIFPGLTVKEDTGEYDKIKVEIQNFIFPGLTVKEETGEYDQIKVEIQNFIFPG